MFVKRAFPKKEFAESCAKNKWSNYKAEPIDFTNLLKNGLSE
jgi:Protein of unknown function (DUF2750)